MHIHLRAIFERISLAYASLMLSPRYILKSSLTLTSRHLATSIRFSKLGWALLVHHLDTGRSRGQIDLFTKKSKTCPSDLRAITVAGLDVVLTTHGTCHHGFSRSIPRIRGRGRARRHRRQRRCPCSCRAYRYILFPKPLSQAQYMSSS